MNGMYKSDTIAAIATPMTGAGIGAIRISGEDAFSIGEKMFRPYKEGKILSEQPSYTIPYEDVVIFINSIKMALKRLDLKVDTCSCLSALAEKL